MLSLRPFHAAYPVNDIQKSKYFYQHVLGCEIGRFTSSWIDFNFFGHQLVFHQFTDAASVELIQDLDTKSVPIPHFGVVLNWKDWDSFIERLRSFDVQFEIEPYTRFANKTGEQKTCFFKDPNGLNLEFKAFKSDSMIFKA